MGEPHGDEPVDVERMDVERVLAGYRQWLTRQPVALRTGCRVQRFR